MSFFHEEIKGSLKSMMQSQKRQRTCWNCEGAVSLEALYCPFCGSDMQQEEESMGEEPSAQYAPVYEPPYSPSQRGYGVPAEVRTDFYHQDHSSYSGRQETESEELPAKKSEAGLWPLLFLSMGMNLMTLGLLLFFFSDRGKLILEWNSYYWFIYCILSVPLLMFGWKLLQASTYQD